jgi:hypothetical protein
MHTYISKWKKYLAEGLKVDAAKKELDLTQKDSQLKLQLAQAKLANAQAEEKAEQEAIKNAEMQKSSSPVNPRLVGGSTTPSSTSPTIGEARNQSFGGLARDALEVSGDSADRPNANEEEITLSEDDVGLYEAQTDEGKSCYMEIMYEDSEECGCDKCVATESLDEAKYQGRTVQLNKPMRGDVKKFKVFVKDPTTGNIKKVNFGDKKMRIKKNIPARRKSFRARHRCESPGPKTKARYWACRSW